VAILTSSFFLWNVFEIFFKVSLMAALYLVKIMLRFSHFQGKTSITLVRNIRKYTWHCVCNIFYLLICCYFSKFNLILKKCSIELKKYMISIMHSKIQQSRGTYFVINQYPHTNISLLNFDAHTLKGKWNLFSVTDGTYHICLFSLFS